MTDTTISQSELALSAEQAYEQALQTTLQMATSHHLAGQIAQAAQLYRAVLQALPEQPQANHGLGLLLLETERPAEALPHLEAALAAKPESELYWLGYIDALAQNGQSELARERLAFARQHGLEGDAANALAARLSAARMAVTPSGVGLQRSA